MFRVACLNSTFSILTLVRFQLWSSVALEPRKQKKGEKGDTAANMTILNP